MNEMADFDAAAYAQIISYPWPESVTKPTTRGAMIELEIGIQTISNNMLNKFLSKASHSQDSSPSPR